MHQTTMQHNYFMGVATIEATLAVALVKVVKSPGQVGFGTFAYSLLLCHKFKWYLSGNQALCCNYFLKTQQLSDPGFAKEFPGKCQDTLIKHSVYTSIYILATLIKYS